MTGVPRAPKLTPDGKPGAWAPSRAMSELSIQMPSSLSEVMPAPVRNDLCAVWVELTVGLPGAEDDAGGCSGHGVALAGDKAIPAPDAFVVGAGHARSGEEGIVPAMIKLSLG